MSWPPISAAGAPLAQALLLLLRLEERAIETGYSHLETLDAPRRATLEALFHALREPAPGLAPVERTLPAPRSPVRISAARRRTLLGQLNARRADSPLDFDEAVCVAAMRRLERIAQRAKAYGDETARREAMRLLVAAAGHDLHEVRNHANLLLERMLAPKEFDAPLACTFLTLVCGAAHRFSFALPPTRGRYRVRIYRGHRHQRYPSETDLDYIDLDLTRTVPGAPLVADYRFEELGHYDFCVIREHSSGRREWLRARRLQRAHQRDPRFARRAGVADLPGHSRSHGGPTGATASTPAWCTTSTGRVIRLGTFADIAAHLPQLKRTYGFTAIYLLGVQKRGSNRKDWSRPRHLTIAVRAGEPGGDGAGPGRQRRPARPGGRRPRAGDEGAGGSDPAPQPPRPTTCPSRCWWNASTTPATWRRAPPPTDATGAGATECCSTTAGWRCGNGSPTRCTPCWRRFDVDGVRCDIAHALPIMMKRNNAPVLPTGRRSDEDQVEGTIVVNEREDDHFVTTGFFDSACRDLIASPLHYLLMRELERTAHGAGKRFYLHLAESYWGREQYLSRVGIVPYNSALFKICEAGRPGHFPGERDLSSVPTALPARAAARCRAGRDVRQPRRAAAGETPSAATTCGRCLPSPRSWSTCCWTTRGTRKGKRGRCSRTTSTSTGTASTAPRTAAWRGSSARCTPSTAAIPAAARWCRPAISRWRRRSNRVRRACGWRCAVSPRTAPR